MPNKPIRKLRDGLITATIWKKPSEKGDRYSVTILRNYKAGEEWKESTSYTPRELLRVSNLTKRAYDCIAQIKSDTLSTER